ncbi:MAG TPA: glycine cleavage system aminomethyltransferase GcvT [Vicinamibacteria bacterium]|jgi:aminomethyltransferase|nr:glycine cleavage system aminomethyltransferase GcvT [Vicinamibacteria bacterium]
MRKTPLNAAHRARGAKMVPFGGWDMPVEYSGLISEHMAVRKAAGLFDVSHMGEFEVEGPGALAFLQRVTANNVAKLVDGQAQYSALPLPTGAPIDDVVVYRRAADRYLLVVNAGNIEKDFRWLQEQGPQACELRNRSDAFALLALQGPRAQEILQALTALDLPALKYYHFVDGDVDGCAVTVSRTGYTGEDGFEIFLPPAQAEAFWTRLLEAGREKGLVPAGLGARDTLRLEARMCLYGQDMDETTSLVEAGLGWIVSTDEAKGDYPGRSLLAEQKKSGAPRKLVGFEVTGRGIARHGYPVLLHDERVGEVTSGTYAPFLQKNIGLCYVPTPRAGVGTELAIDIRERKVSARVVATPFYKRPDKSAHPAATPVVTA